jgi:hypothetical protein
VDREDAVPRLDRRPAKRPSASSAAPRLTEALLFRLWAGQRFPESALVTAQGVPLRVLQPGRAGRGAGPDFRDAIIAPPSGPLLRGDVELHVRAADFVSHGHAADARYNRVVLHVVFDGGTSRQTRLASGRSVPVVPLLPWLERRAQEIEGWLQSPMLWREPCQDAVARLGRDTVLTFLESLGDERFAQREDALADLIERHGAPEALYRALLEAVAYGGDRSLPDIADSLPYGELAGRFEATTPGDRAALAERLLISHLHRGEGGPAMRPANRPERRVSGLAVLLARHHPLDPQAALPKGDGRALIAAWSAPPHIGRSRAIELLTNAVLPWAAARAQGLGRDEDAAGARRAFAALPRPASYGSLAFLEENLRVGPLNARRQQGLLALYKSECTTGGCGRCRLS